MAVLAAGYVMTGALPRSADSQAARILAETWLRLRPEKLRALEAKMQLALREAATGRDLVLMAREHYQMRFETGWGRIRGLHRAGWTPSVRIDGLDWVRRGVAAGRGVILWRMAFCSTPAVLLAFQRAGFPLVVLSHQAHGSTNMSRVGLSTISPAWQRIENRLSDCRIVIPLDRSPGYVLTLIRQLKQNKVVSIVGEHEGTRNVTVPFLNRERSFAIGAPSFAWDLGSMLLPVYAVREGPFDYRVVIDSPIQPDRSQGREAFLQRAVAEYARLLERRIIARPADWRGWETRIV